MSLGLISGQYTSVFITAALLAVFVHPGHWVYQAPGDARICRLAAVGKPVGITRPKWRSKSGEL